MSEISYEVLDKAKVLSFHRRVTVLAALGPFSDAFNEFGAATSLLATSILFHLSAVMTSIVVAGYWVGVAGGGILGMLSDKIGRKQLFIYDTLGMATFALLSAASFNGISYFVFRFLLGIFIGIDYSAAVPLVSEYAPVAARGRLLSMEKIFFMIGAIATAAIGLGLTAWVGVLTAWRIDFIIAAIPPLILFVLRRKMPESLRWAVEAGNKKKAEETVSMLEKYGLKPKVNLDAIQEKKISLWQNLKTFFSRTYARQVVYIFWIGAAYALTVNLVSVYSPKVLADLGATSFESVLGFTIIEALGTFGVVLALFTVDKVGRRILGTLGFGLGAIPLAVVYVAYLMGILTIPLVVAMFSLFYFINVGFVGTLQYIPAGEVFPTRLRGLSVGWEKLYEFGVALPALTLYAYLGVANSLIYDIIVSIVAAVIFYFVSLETKQMSLEEIERRYAGIKGTPS